MDYRERLCGCHEVPIRRAFSLLHIGGFVSIAVNQVVGLEELDTAQYLDSSMPAFG